MHELEAAEQLAHVGIAQGHCIGPCMFYQKGWASIPPDQLCDTDVKILLLSFDQTFPNELYSTPRDNEQFQSQTYPSDKIPEAYSTK